MNRREYLAALSIGAVSGCVGNENDPEEIQTTIEGEGSLLREFEVELDGPVVFEIESPSRVEAKIVPGEDSGESTQSIVLEDNIPSAEILEDLRPGEYALDVSSEGSWSVRIVQYPVISPSGATQPDYPIELEGETSEVFGPYNFDGFLRVSASSDNMLVVVFADSSGESIKRLAHDGTAPRAPGESDGAKEFSAFQVGAVGWISCIVGTDEDIGGSSTIDYTVTVGGTE